MTSIASLLIKSGSYINGQWLTGENTFNVSNPFNGELIHSIHNANKADATLAIECAAASFTVWSKETAEYRAQKLKCWFDLILKHKASLAQLLSLEQGKPIGESRGEIEYGASFIEWYAEEAKRVYGDTIPANSQDKKIIVVKQPVGVVTAITPWNFPVAMITRKAAAALAAGCTFVVKPAHQTPLSALALAELADQAEIPAGVFNVVTSNKAAEVGEVLTQHLAVNKFTFTGSTPVGQQLMAQCAQSVKKVSLELGGNAPFIVFEDADIDQAVKGFMLAKFRNAGQTCICANRLLLADAIYDEFIHKLEKAVASLTLGDGLNGTTDIGPLISEDAVNRIKHLVEQSIAMGAKSLFSLTEKLPANTFYPPSIITQVTEEMPIAVEEIFGPVVAVMRFKTEAEAMTMANNTNSGLAAYFYARDIGRVWRVSTALNYGMVGINDAAISNTAAPFGGMKQSGIGREGSKYGLDDYLEIKYLSMGGL